MLRKFITGVLPALALSSSLLTAVAAGEGAPADGPGGPSGQFQILYRSSPDNPWSFYASYAVRRDAEIAAEQLASTGWEVQVTGAAPVARNQFKVLYRSSPDNPWGFYGSYTARRDAEIAAEQLASTGWEVQVVGPAVPEGEK